MTSKNMGDVRRSGEGQHLEILWNLSGKPLPINPSPTSKLVGEGKFYIS